MRTGVTLILASGLVWGSSGGDDVVDVGLVGGCRSTSLPFVEGCFCSSDAESDSMGSSLIRMLNSLKSPWIRPCLASRRIRPMSSA